MNWNNLITIHIQKGGMGIITKYWDAEKCTYYVHKHALNKSFEKFIQNEYQKLHSLKHRNLPKVLCFHNDGILMEHIEGMNLYEFIQSARMSQSIVYVIAIQLLGVLMYIHQHKIIHNDLKPQNLMVEKTFNLILIDFGLSVDKYDKSLCVYGTKQYRKHTLNISYDTDFYAFSCILDDLLLQTTCNYLSYEYFKYFQKKLLGKNIEIVVDELYEELKCYYFYSHISIIACLLIQFLNIVLIYFVFMIKGFVRL